MTYSFKQILFSIFICLQILSSNTFAQGFLDYSFSDSGTASIDYNLQTDEMYAIDNDNMGNIFVAGRTSDINSKSDFFIAKYKQNGLIDSSFGNNGKFLYDKADYDRAIDLTIQNDGKIVFCGIAFDGTNAQQIVIRININGVIDSSFALNGIYTHIYNEGAFESVEMQQDGKIVICGYTYISGTESINLVRLNQNGTLDNSFGVTGNVLTNLFSTTTSCRGRSIKLQSDGKIALTGYVNYGIAGSIYLVRYNSNGSLDSTFDNDGISYIPIISGEGFELEIQKDSKIVVVGKQGNFSNWDFFVGRWNANGTLDSTFGNNGIFHYHLGLSDNEFTSLEIDSFGKIICAGHFRDSNTYEYGILCRLNSNGSFDMSFGKQGISMARPGDYGSYFEDIKTVNGGEVIYPVGKYYSNSSGNGLLQKYSGFCNLGVPNISRIGDTLKCNISNIQYQWLDCNDNYSIISNASNEFYLPSTSGDYAVSIYKNGCYDTSNCFAFIPLNVETSSIKNGIEIFPNPLKNILNIKSVKKIKNCKITNLIGEEVYNEVYNSSIIDVSKLNRGIYIIHLIGESGIFFSSKIVKN